MNDQAFIRGDVPMTKAEIRAIVLHKLDLQANDTMMDIGAGTGSVSIEAAQRLTNGRVVAIERNTEGIGLIHQNCAAHNISNLRVIEAQAPDGLEEASLCNKFFVGGSGGQLEAILSVIRHQAPKQSTVVITAITLDTLQKAMNYCNQHFSHTDVVQVQVNTLKTIKSTAMLMAANPIFIITATT